MMRERKLCSSTNEYENQTMAKVSIDSKELLILHQSLMI